MSRASTTPSPASSWKPSKATPACASPLQDWLQALREACSKVGALLILDEIQCGMGRTGKPWAFQHFGIVPDVLCMGKALGGGMAMGGLAASKAHLGLFAHGPSLGHITTFGGHPMACAGAIGALESLGKLDFEHVERQNQRWQDALEGHPAVRTVRRLGAFIAVELEDAQAVQKAVEGGLRRSGGEGVLLFWFLSVPHAFQACASPHLHGRGNDRRTHADFARLGSGCMKAQPRTNPRPQGHA